MTHHTCLTCSHWTAPDPDGSHIAETRFGDCTGIKPQSEMIEYDDDMEAVLKPERAADTAFGYLFTTADHYCAMHEPKEDG